MARAIILMADSLGIGAAPDAGKFGDVVRKEKKEKGLLQKKGCKKKYR